MLARSGAARVDGYDLSPDVIAEAQRTYPLPGINFLVADVMRLPAPDETYDLFTSFETIEHVSPAESYLAEIWRVLKPDGVLLCSTPNRRVTNPGIAITDKPFNRFHLREYDVQAFEELLHRYFARVELWGQSLYRSTYVGLLNRIGNRFPWLAARCHQVRKVMGIAWESRRRHEPVRLNRHAVPEVLIAVCRK